MTILQQKYHDAVWGDTHPVAVEIPEWKDEK